MSKTLRLTDDKVKATAIDWVRRAPVGSTVTFARPKRTVPQNDLMWSLLGQLSEKAKYHGYTFDPESWKLIMLSGVRKDVKIVPNLDNDGIVSLDRSTSRLSVAEMNMMIEVIEAWADQNGVKLVRTMPGLEPPRARSTAKY